MAKTVPEVLFVCVHNAGRSQIAASFTQAVSDGCVHVRSAGSTPSSEINPAVVEAMNEIGLDLSQEYPKPLTDEVVEAADVVITMGCGDACPIYPGKRYEDWEVPDPAGRPLDQVRPIRDQIKARVIDLLRGLGVEPGVPRTGSSGRDNCRRVKTWPPGSEVYGLLGCRLRRPSGLASR